MLQLEHISYAVPEGNGTKTILKDVSLSLNERFIVITGPNGSGKSTLAKIIAGILKPTGGKITFNGTDITDFSITERAKAGISFAFQQPVRFKGLTVMDLMNLAAGKRLSVGKVCEYLSEVGLCAKEYVNRELNASLSGGELKRIEIAMTLARGAKISIMDEPEAGIDLWSFQSLIKVFEKLYRETNDSIIIISHQERILNIADRVIVLENGSVTADGSKDQVLPAFLSGACPRIG
ncbi:MAG: ATP-binding cassette domain-containing protein [Clostridia bacterium]|nr:ATP-binding cassette domain-containing protein [Clostridia bacterium]